MTIEFANQEEFDRQVANLSAALEREAADMLGGLKDTAVKILMLMGTYAAKYPPPPPGSTYRRTRTLGRLWTTSDPVVTVSGKLLNARIGNATPYGPYVQDEDLQAKVHRGRWQTTKEVIDEHKGIIEPMLKKFGLEITERIANAV